MRQESMESNFTSMHPTVEFLDILEAYSSNEELHCKFKFNDYTPQKGDRVAIFKIGWTLVKDFVAFEWAPVSPVAPEDRQYFVNFNRDILPKNSTEVYQICYVNSENELHGASTPFQFYSGDNLNSVSSVLSCIPKHSIDDVMTRSQIKLEIIDKDHQIECLKEENALLKESLKALISQNKDKLTKDYDKDIHELKESTKDIKSMVLLHQQEIDMLKSKITEGGEEYKKLYVEKVRIERKYEKLKSKWTEKQSFHEGVKPTNDPNFDIGDLKSIPPFPAFLK